MLYNEFVEGTGCADNAHNYKVYKNLEIMYMNSDMSKAEIYEYGKKLVDNNWKSEATLKLEAEIKAEIEACKSKVEYYKQELVYNKNSRDYWKSEGDKFMVDCFKNSIEYDKREIKSLRTRIAELKWVLGE